MARTGENKVTPAWFKPQGKRGYGHTDSEKLFLRFWQLYMMRRYEPEFGLWCYQIEHFLEKFCFVGATKERSQFASAVFQWLGTSAGSGFLTHQFLKEIKNSSHDSHVGYLNDQLAIMRWAKENARQHGMNSNRRTLEAIKGGALSVDDFEIAEGVMRFVINDSGRTLVTKILHEINKTPYGGWGITWETPVEPEEFDTWLASED